MPASVRLVQYSLRERSSSELELSPVLNRRRLGASKSIEEQVTKEDPAAMRMLR